MKEIVDSMDDKLGPVVTFIILLIGTLKGLGWIYYTFSYIKKFALTWPLDILTRYSGKGTWAVVTGSGDGIGAEMTKRFARRGFNIVLISRTKSKIEKVAEELKKINPNIKTKVIGANFKDANNIAFYHDIYKQIADLDISVAMINAGIMPAGH